MELTCKRCGRKFVWVAKQPKDQAPQYHSPSCQKAASLDRKKKRDSQIKDPESEFFCPTPMKVKHASWIAAGHVIDKVDRSMSAYRCRCGWIHVGHAQIA